jgi:hypothetical protein
MESMFMNRKEIVLQDLSADIIKDDVIQRLMSFSNVLVHVHQAFLQSVKLN